MQSSAKLSAARPTTRHAGAFKSGATPPPARRARVVMRVEVPDSLKEAMKDPAVAQKMAEMRDAMARPEVQQEIQQMQAYMQNQQVQQRMQVRWH